MNTFHDLFRQPTRKSGDGFPPDRRGELFPRYVERSPKLHLWSPGQPVPDHGPRLLIGVVMWSGYDLNLLDLIEESPANRVRVDVFDLDRVVSPATVSEYIPSAEHPLQSPFVGYWNDGQHLETASGFHGRALVARVLNLPQCDLESRLQSVYTRK